MARVLLMLMVMVLTSRAEDTTDNALGPPPLQIDPQLRRALLQALTQLEKEAQEESNFTTEQPEESPTEDYEFPTEEPAVETDSYQKPPDTEKEGGEEEKPPPEQELENLDFQNTEAAVQSFSEVRINFENKSEKEGNSSVQTSTTGNLPSRVVTETVDVRSNEISDKKPEIVKPELVESVSITVKETKEIEGKAEKEEAASSTNVNPKIEEHKNVNASDKEVAFFEAPLVAAFTLHHDERGLPKSVVPLFRQEQSSANSQSESFSLSKEQELEQRTIKLQEQLLQLQQQQIQQQQFIKQQQLLKESQERERVRQQRAFQEEQRLKQQQLFREQQERQARQQRFQLQQEQKIRQLQQQQQQQQQPQFFSQEQQLPRLRSQRQEQGTAIVDFQKSVDVPFRTTPAPVVNNLQFSPRPSSSIPTAPNFFRNQQQQTFSTFNTNFNSNNNLNTNFNRNNNFNSNFNSNNNLNTNLNNNNNFNSNLNFNKNFNNLNNNNNFQPSRQNFITSQSQQYRTIVQQDPSLSSSFSDNINTFQTPPSVSSSFSSNFNTFQSPPTFSSFFPSNFNTFQTPPSVISPFSNNLNTFQQPPTVDTQLKSLLFQSGVAGELQSNIRNGASPLEDLNILSKVLLLDPENHKGRPGRTTQEGHHIHNSQSPSRQHSIPRV